MIDGLQRLAERLRFVRPVFLASGALASGAAGVELFGGGFGEQDYLGITLIVMLWSILGFSALGLFRDVPTRTPEGERGFARLKRQVARGLFYLVAAAFVVATLVGMYMTLKLIQLA